MKVGNTPTVRLEQDGSSEFTAQKCVVAGYEADFLSVILRSKINQY